MQLFLFTVIPNTVDFAFLFKLRAKDAVLSHFFQSKSFNKLNMYFLKIMIFNFHGNFYHLQYIFMN